MAYLREIPVQSFEFGHGETRALLFSRAFHGATE